MIRNISSLNRFLEIVPLRDICRPQHGDCVNVAVAIQEVFGGTYVCVYENEHSTIPVHATVKIDGELFDGDGKTTQTNLKSRVKSTSSNIIRSPQSLQSTPQYDRECVQEIIQKLQKQKA